MSLGIGVIGAGTVGGGVIETLLGHKADIEARTGVDPELVHVADTNTEALAEYPLKGVRVSANAEELIDDPKVDTVCELIGGLEPAKTFILRALKQGKSVVTANKMLLAHAGPELTEAALGGGAELRYEAAVAGGIPIIKALREGLAANAIHRVYGILNGTCNYILTRMTHEGLEFGEVLLQAQAQGFAETPPDLDVEGHDTAHKCQIIASLCYNTQIDLGDIPVEGITDLTSADIRYAHEMGYALKLLAVIQDGGGAIEARVHPALVPEGHLLASVRHEFNAVYVESAITGPTLYYGRGAGRLPTASAVVADIIDIGRRGGAKAPPPFVYGPRRAIRSVDTLMGRYYLRLTTRDEPGVLGRVCTILGEHEVSIASCIQRESRKSEAVHVVLMTHHTKEAGLRAALDRINQMDAMNRAARMIRVLEAGAE